MYKLNNSFELVSCLKIIKFMCIYLSPCSYIHFIELDIWQQGVRSAAGLCGLSLRYYTPSINLRKIQNPPYITDYRGQYYLGNVTKSCIVFCTEVSSKIRISYILATMLYYVACIANKTGLDHTQWLAYLWMTTLQPLSPEILQVQQMYLVVVFVY